MEKLRKTLLGPTGSTLDHSGSFGSTLDQVKDIESSGPSENMENSVNWIPPLNPLSVIFILFSCFSA